MEKIKERRTVSTFFIEIKVLNFYEIMSFSTTRWLKLIKVTFYGFDYSKIIDKLTHVVVRTFYVRLIYDPSAIKRS